MATISLFNHTANLFADGSNAEGDTYTVKLYSSLTPDLTDTTITEVDATGSEVANANGYTSGGQNLANVTVATVTTNDASFDADDVVWTASGGSITATHAVIYNNTDAGDPPLAVIDFEGTETAGDGTEFRIVWNASGIFAFTVA